MVAAVCVFAGRVGSLVVVAAEAKAKAESSRSGVVEEPTEFKAGLRSKEEMKAARLAREERQRQLHDQEEQSPIRTTTEEAEEVEQETIYRDSSGRIINIRIIVNGGEKMLAVS